MRRAHERSEALLRQAGIIDEASGAAHQRIVLEPHFTLAVMGRCLAVHVHPALGKRPFITQRMACNRGLRHPFPCGTSSVVAALAARDFPRAK